MDEVVNLRNKYAYLLDKESLDFIEKETNKVIESSSNVKKYNSIFHTTIKKYVLGGFEINASINFLDNYLNNLFEKKLDDKDYFKNISSFFEKFKINFDFEVILKMVNNKNFNTYLQDIFNRYKDLIISDKANEVVDDDLFCLFMDVFLEINGIEKNTSDLIQENSLESLDSTYMFLSEIYKYKLLTKDEEREYFMQLANGKEEYQNKILEHNLRLVVSVAKRYIGVSSLSFLDLVQEGCIGLMKAIKSFDYTKNYKFSTYATYRIRQSMSYAISSYGHMVALPAWVQVNKRKFKEVFYKLKKDLGRTPTVSELVLETNFTEKQIKNLLLLPELAISLDAKTGIDTEETYGETVIDISQNIELEVEKKMSLDYIEKMMNEAGLTEQEKNILILYTGLYGNDEHTLEEIGKYENITRERVRQIKLKALNKIRMLKNISSFAIYTDYPSKSVEYIIDTRNKLYDEMLNRANVKIENNSLINLYEYFKEYRKDEVIDVINSLNELDKEILLDVYGDLYNPYRYDLPENRSDFYCIVQKITRRLKKYKKSIVMTLQKTRK